MTWRHSAVGLSSPKFKLNSRFKKKLLDARMAKHRP